MSTISQLPRLDDYKVVNRKNVNEFLEKGHTLINSVLSPEEISVYRPVIVNAAEKYNTEKRKMAERDTYGKAFLQAIWRTEPPSIIGTRGCKLNIPSRR